MTWCDARVFQSFLVRSSFLFVEWASWPAPVVSFTAESNAAVTSGYSVTVSGVSFSIGALTPTATVGYSSCGTAAWASSTSLVCMMAVGESSALTVGVTVSGVVGTRTSSFSYDGADPRDRAGGPSDIR